MIALVIVLRIVHILAGVFWAGATFSFARYIEPNATALGPDGMKFLQRLAAKTAYTHAMMGAGLATVVAGLALMWIDSGGFKPAWMGSGMGIVLSVGMLTGLLAAVIGIVVAAVNAKRLGGIANAIEAQGAPPTAEQTAQIAMLKGRLTAGGRWAAVLLLVTVICMAAARYVAF